VIQPAYVRNVSDSASTSSAPPAPSQLPNAAIDLPLYCAGGVKFLGNAKFDTAIVAFIDCVNQLQQRVQHMHTTLQQTASSEVDAQTVSSSAFTLPYTMLKDKLIGGEREYSVKTEFNSEERWTKAMKYLLTNMKWLLTWTAALDP
jgi:beclin 1